MESTSGLLTRRLKQGVVHVRQQVKILGPHQVFASPKGRKTRDVPLPESVALAVEAYLQDYPAREAGLPWGSVEGGARTFRLLVTSRESGPLNRNYVNRKIWKPALVAAGVDPSRENGMHALRYFYASVLLDAGESIRALATYLGHASPASPCGSTRTSCPPARSARSARSTAH